MLVKQRLCPAQAAIQEMIGHKCNNDAHICVFSTHLIIPYSHKTRLMAVKSTVTVLLAPADVPYMVYIWDGWYCYIPEILN